MAPKAETESSSERPAIAAERLFSDMLARAAALSSGEPALKVSALSFSDIPAKAADCSAGLMLAMEAAFSEGERTERACT